MSRPARRPGLRVVREGDRYLLRAEDGRTVALNESALALWQLCDGDTDAEEMVDAVTRAANLNLDQATRDVQTTLRLLTEAEALTWTD